MKKAEHVTEAKKIAANSYGLMHFDALPDNASIREQIDALRADQSWQEMHAHNIRDQFNALITKLMGVER